MDELRLDDEAALMAEPTQSVSAEDPLTAQALAWSQTQSDKIQSADSQQVAVLPADSIKLTVEAAKDHVARIRRDKGLDLGVLDGDLGSNVSDLTAALEVWVFSISSVGDIFLSLD